jgi:ribosomal protein L7/L12
MSGGNVYMDDLRPYFDKIGRRLESLEQQMVLVSEKVGLTYTPITAGVPQDVVALVRDGDMLGALKRYRELTGVSLDEAKAAVQGL